MTSNKSNSETIKLKFAPTSPHSPHVLQTIQGSVPPDILTEWTDEFRKVYERESKKRPPFEVELKSENPEWTMEFVVSFYEHAKDHQAELTSTPKPVKLAKASLPTIVKTEKVDVEQMLITWRDGLLAELQVELESWPIDEDRRATINYTFDRFVEFLNKEPRQSLLSMFALFLRTPSRFDEDSDGFDLRVRQAAAAVISEQVLDQGFFSPGDEPANASSWWHSFTGLWQRQS